MRTKIRSAAIILASATGAAAASLAYGQVLPTVQRQQVAPPKAMISMPPGQRPVDAGQRLLSLLTADQCRSAGGDVMSGDEIATLCKSGSYCITVDANKVAHRVCLSAQ